ncbi:transmembrane signal receptor [Lithospermum erythrorhizon]
MLGTSLLSWMSKKQNTVSRSFVEVEYISVAFADCELQWLTYLLADLKVPIEQPIPLWCDNQSTIYNTENPVFHERTKHIEMDCHTIRDQYKRGFVKSLHVPSKD